MSRRAWLRALLAATLPGMAIGAIAACGPDGVGGARSRSASDAVGAQRAASPLVKSLTTIHRNSKSLEWAHGPNKILFDALGRDGYYDVHVVAPDGSGDQCLTCAPGAPSKHNGNATWRSQGDYIVFTAEKGEVPKAVDRFGIPGAGVGADLWAMTADGRQFFQLTDLPFTLAKDAKGTIHPQFSRDGRKVAWAERQAGGGAFGVWSIRIADFVVGARGPTVENVRTWQPGQQKEFYETHDWSPDGSRLLFCANAEPKQPGYGLDLYELNLVTGEHRSLAASPETWDEHAHYSPDGTKIAWMSSKDLSIAWGNDTGKRFHELLKTELWLMNADGTNPHRLTHFNQEGSPEYAGRRTVVSDNAWSPDGKRIVATVAYEGRRGQIAGSDMVMVDLAL